MCSVRRRSEPASHGVALSFGVRCPLRASAVIGSALPSRPSPSPAGPQGLYAMRLPGCVSTASASSHGLTLSYRVLQTPSRRPLLAVAASSGSPARPAPPMRFIAPSAFPHTRQLLNDAVCLTASPCALRFSQPLDALLRHVPAGLVSCQIRSWGCALQSFAPLHRAVRRLRRRAPLDVWYAPSSSTSSDRGSGPKPELPVERTDTPLPPTCDLNRSPWKHGATSPLPQSRSHRSARCP
jgi:hypothetical protein